VVELIQMKVQAQLAAQGKNPAAEAAAAAAAAKS
jgi:hypothetical protein